MADMFKLQVVTPDKFFYTGEVSMVELTTTEGEIGVYAQHIPMTSIVAPGVLSIHEGSEVKKAALHSGFVEVLPDAVTILAEVVEWPCHRKLRPMTQKTLWHGIRFPAGGIYNR